MYMKLTIIIKRYFNLQSPLKKKKKLLQIKELKINVQVFD